MWALLVGVMMWRAQADAIADPLSYAPAIVDARP